MVGTHRIALRGWSLPGATAHRIALGGYSLPPTAPTLQYKRLLDTSPGVALLDKTLAVRLLDTSTAVTFEETT